jgi:mannobiose 2-epimerase
MEQEQAMKKMDPIMRALAGGLSRRKAIKLLLQGAIGGLLVEGSQSPLPALAQEEPAQQTYLPSLSNTNSAPLGDLCSDDAECSDEECCEATVAVDFNWFRSHLRQEILPKWAQAVTDEGLFLPHFDRQWRPLNRNYGTLVSQCRLLYNFAEGYALTGNTTYRNAVERGVQFLLNRFRDNQHGGWFWACNLDGSVRDNSKDAYGHAFAIFGLAYAYRCLGYSSIRSAMLHTWDIMQYRFRDTHGGYHTHMTRDFKPASESKSQNPLMHLFEALLAAGTVGGEAQLLKEARTVGNFVFNNLVRVQDRRLPETFDLEWNELSASAGGQLSLGHAFEWAFLASRAAELGFPSRYQNYANSFLNYGMALGFDWENGGIFSPAKPNGTLINQEKGWWEQCEAIRALTHFYLRHNRQDCLGPLQKLLNFAKGAFIDPQYGGWYARIGPGITPTSQQKGSEWKVDYHVVGMCMEAIRLTG